MENYSWHSNTDKGKCIVTIKDDQFIIEGDYCVVKNREIVKSDKKCKTIPISNYIGASNSKIKSERRLNMLLPTYFIVSVIKIIVNTISDFVSKADEAKSILNGEFFQVFINRVLALLPFPTSSDPFTIFLAIIQFIVIIIFVMYITSKKDVYEFTFNNMRVAVDKLYMKEYDFLGIKNEIERRKNK